MRQLKFALPLLATAVLAACGGGGGGGNQALKLKFSSQVSFGDSLSDIGTYAVGTVKALGGGKFTVNSPTGKNWTELMAAQLGLPAPCPAQTGLEGDASKGFSVPVVFNTGCFGYAQGGARVTQPVGPGNKVTGSPLGSTTVPVATQVQRHLVISGGAFKGDEMVLVMAGGNDVLMQMGILSAGAFAAGQQAGGAAVQAAVPGQIQKDIASGVCKPADAKASNCVAAAVALLTSTVGKEVGEKAGKDYFTASAPLAVLEMGKAGAELANLVKNQMLAKGAKYVTVVNLPDVANTPYALEQSAEVKALVAQMVDSFNKQLSDNLGTDSRVLAVDAFAVTRDQITNPGPYGLTNVKDRACDMNPAKNPLGSSLVCNPLNLVAGDTSRYMFADDVHPTPFTGQLLARYVSEKMIVKGWM